MNKLDAEIVYDTKEGRGYEFVEHTRLSQKAKELIWLSALPSGGSWNKPRYQDIVITKTFRVENKFAVSRIHVTSEQDEGGRKGILNARINLYSKSEYANWLASQSTVGQDILYQIELLIRVCLERVSQRTLSNSKLIIHRPFRGQQDVDTNLAILAQLCQRKEIIQKLINPYANITFTSLTLSPDDQSLLLCVPQDEMIGSKPGNINIKLVLQPRIKL